MPEVFLRLGNRDRADALGVASEKSQRAAHLLEKDVWVVWALRTMFESRFGPHLVFKGGTSLSKAFGAIRRFSEDVDLTYDIRALVPDLVKEGDDESLPQTGSQAKKWREKIDRALGRWVNDEVLPLLQKALREQLLVADVRTRPDDKHAVQIQYEPAAEGTGYVRPIVMLEFGAKSTGEPCDPVSIRCDAASFLHGLSFPQATPRVMKVERTFWEKATAVHVVCMGGKVRGSGRFSRHLYDLAQLAASGHGATALGRRDIAKQVARHKSIFFIEKTELGGTVIDYALAVSGELRLVATGAQLAALADDYRKMIEDGLLEDPTPFETILEACRALQDRANAVSQETTRT